MLVLALLMVLISNYMEERLANSKAVLSIGCRVTNPTEEDDERKPILPRVGIKSGVN